MIIDTIIPIEAIIDKFGMVRTMPNMAMIIIMTKSVNSRSMLFIAVRLILTESQKPTRNLSRISLSM